MSEKPKTDSDEPFRTTVTINGGLYKKAVILMKEGDFSRFAEYIESLIREKWEARSKSK